MSRFFAAAVIACVLIEVVLDVVVCNEPLQARRYSKPVEASD